MAKSGAGVRGNSPYGQMGGPPYPEGVEAPAERYYTGYNIMGNIIKPPYSTLTAYDLNKGTIKWQVPVGDDLRALQEGVHDTGAIGIRVGMVTTSTGLVFLAGGDMKIRAYDQETGKVVWTANLPDNRRISLDVRGRRAAVSCGECDVASGSSIPLDHQFCAAPRLYRFRAALGGLLTGAVLFGAT